MKAPIYALLVATMLSAPFAAFAEEGPRPSSYHDWPGMTNATPPAVEPVATPFDGTRPSSLDNWHGMTGTTLPPNASSVDPSFEGVRPSPNH